MKWFRYTIHTVEEAEDAISGLLYSLGISGIEIVDKKPVEAEANGGLFGEVLPDLPEDDHKADISFYTCDAEAGERGLLQNGIGAVPAGVPAEDPERIDQVRAGLDELRAFMDIGAGSIARSGMADEDWAGKWKEYYHPFLAGDILVTPAWESDPDQEKKAACTVRIDPGAAFGTGTHESTRLAMDAVRRYVKPGQRLLDIGTGSGILGIIAIKSGASFVTGTDIDDNALPAARENAALNGIPESRFSLVLGDVGSDAALRGRIVSSGGFDVIAANLIAEIIVRIAPHIPELLNQGGFFITSGILKERAHLVRRACRDAGLQFIEARDLGEWTGLVFSI